MALLEARNVSKTYPARRGTRLLTARGGIFDWIRGRKAERVDVLKGITLEAEPGDIVGIIGRNGSGKSTLLKILAGVTLPSQGEVIVRGRCASLLELGAGFHPHLTGRENVYLNAGLLGMRHAQVDGVMDQILEFAGIGDAIEEPVETYSSGMYVRLAFSVAVHANPDIFLVDEVLSVGDEEFQRKCRRRIAELRSQGKTIIVVSHDLGTVSALCNRIVLLDGGAMVVRETPRQTIEYYLRQIGRAGGVHSMARGALEVIFNNGQASIFHGGGEVTVPPGIALHIKVYGGNQHSGEADWRIDSQSPESCEATGVMQRIPLCIHWRTELQDETVQCRIALECVEPLHYDRITVSLLLPLAHQKFYLGDTEHSAPVLEPWQLEWNPFCSSDFAARTCLAVPEDSDAARPFLVRGETHAPYASMALANSDYVTNARAILYEFIAPTGGAEMPAGMHEFLRLELTPAVRDEALRTHLDDWEARRVIEVDGLKAVLSGGGGISLYAGGRLLTRTIEAHFAYCINGIWSHSWMTMSWARVRREGETLYLSGESTRLPFKQHWELRPVAGGIGWKVWLEPSETLEAQEYSAGIVLDGEYATWHTPLESGSFPVFDPEDERWLHLNRDFTPSEWIRVEGPGLPALTLCAEGETPRLRMTAVNTGASQGARVIQAIAAGEGPGPMILGVERRLCFDGVIKIGDVGA